MGGADPRVQNRTYALNGALLADLLIAGVAKGEATTANAMTQAGGTRAEHPPFDSAAALSASTDRLGRVVRGGNRTSAERYDSAANPTAN